MDAIAAALSELSIEAAIALVGVVAVVLAFAKNFLTRDRAWEKTAKELQERIDAIEQPATLVKIQHDDLKSRVVKLEEKQEKLTDLIIDYHQRK